MKKYILIALCALSISSSAMAVPTFVRGEIESLTIDNRSSDASHIVIRIDGSFYVYFGGNPGITTFLSDAHTSNLPVLIYGGSSDGIDFEAVRTDF